MEVTNEIFEIFFIELRILRLIPGQHTRLTYILAAMAVLTDVWMLYYSIKLTVFGVQNHDVVMFTDGITSIVAHIQGFKVFLLFNAKLGHIFEAAKEFWSSESISLIEMNIWRFLKYYRYSVYITLCTTFYLPTVVLGLIAFPGMFPEFTGSNMVYGIIQCFEFSYFASVVIIVDGLFMSIIMLIYAQFILLNERIQTIANTMHDGKLMNGEIEKCIRHHDFLLKLCDKAISLFKVCMGSQYLIVTIAICIEAVVYESRDFNDKVLRSFYSVALMMQLSFYCLPADYCGHEAERLANTMFHSNWFENPYFGKTYTQRIIQRSQVPIDFSAGGIITINREAYVKFFQNFLSIHALLKDLKDN